MKSVSRRSFVTLLGTSAASAPILFNTIGSAVASDKTDPARKHIKGVKMALTDEEIAILNGKQGPTMAKVLKSVLLTEMLLKHLIYLMCPMTVIG